MNIKIFKKSTLFLALALLLCTALFFTSCSLEALEQLVQGEQQEEEAEEKTKRPSKRTTEPGESEEDPNTTEPKEENDPLASVGLSYHIDPVKQMCSVMGIGSCTDTHIRIPNQINGYAVTEIQSGAFHNNSQITGVTLPSTIESIGESAFDGCPNLCGNTYQNGIYLGSDENPYLYLYQLVDKKISTIEIHPETRMIAGNTFGDCTNLTDLVIPAKVSKIGLLAFYNCGSLASITVAPQNAFYHSEGNCLIETASKSLILGCKNSIIPTNGSVTRIEKRAFNDCRDLKELTIPSTVTSIGQSALDGCESLIQTENGICYVDNWAVGYSDSIRELVLRENTVGISDFAFWSCSALKDLTLPTHLRYVGEEAFWSCGQLTSVKFLGGTISLGKCSFWSCSQLTSVTILDGSVIIGDSAFLSCPKLTKVTVLGGEVAIGATAFWSCDALAELFLLGGTVSISANAFWICDNLQSVYFFGTKEEWETLSIHQRNDELFAATLYCYSPTEPTDPTGSYWHYLNGEPTPW